jgi:hypothetical protein
MGCRLALDAFRSRTDGISSFTVEERDARHAESVQLCSAKSCKTDTRGFDQSRYGTGHVLQRR